MRHHIAPLIVLTVTLLLPGLLILSFEVIGNPDPEEAPEWRLNDFWTYRASDAQVAFDDGTSTYTGTMTAEMTYLMTGTTLVGTLEANELTITGTLNGILNYEFSGFPIQVPYSGTFSGKRYNSEVGLKFIKESLTTSITIDIPDYLGMPDITASMVETTTWSPVLDFFAFPFDSGDSWNLASTRTMDVSGTFSDQPISNHATMTYVENSCSSLGNIQVSGATYSAFHLEWSATNSDSSMCTGEYWYAHDVGNAVKEHWTNLHTGSIQYSEIVWELINYQFTPDINDPPSISDITINPQEIPNDGLTRATVAATVTDPEGLADIVSVKINLGPLNGALESMFDDGNHGDATAGDGTYTLMFATTAVPESYNLPVTVTDTANNQDVKSVTLLVKPDNLPPKLSRPTVAPSTVKNDGTGTITITAKVDDPDGLLDIVSVAADLAQLDGSTVLLFDDGLDADVTERDGVYTVRLAIPEGTSPGTKIVGITVEDSKAHTDRLTVMFTVEAWNHQPIITSALATPSEATNSGLETIVLAVGAIDPDENIVSVVVDLAPFGGIPQQRMYDDGTHGDEHGSDDVYSFEYPIARTLSPGEFILQVRCTDEGGLLASSSILVSVLRAEYPPAITSTLVNPNTIHNDGASSFVLAVAASDPDTNLNLVFIDLTPLGGDSFVRLFDDGQTPDQANNDGIFSTQYTVPSSVTPGTFKLVVTANDLKGNSMSQNVSVTILAVPSDPGPDTNTTPGDDNPPANGGNPQPYIPPITNDGQLQRAGKQSGLSSGYIVIIVAVIIAVVVAFVSILLTVRAKRLQATRSESAPQQPPSAPPKADQEPYTGQGDYVPNLVEPYGYDTYPQDYNEYANQAVPYDPRTATALELPPYDPDEYTAYGSMPSQYPPNYQAPSQSGPAQSYYDPYQQQTMPYSPEYGYGASTSTNPAYPQQRW